MKITVYGRGGHGSMPQATVDPVVLAAMIVVRLQFIISREVASTETAVLTVGSIRAGSKSNVIPDSAELQLNVRTYSDAARTTALVHHTDAGSQYTSIAFTDRLVDVGIDPSVGSIGDAYDNALAESQIGIFKSELIWPHGPWRDRDHLESAVLDWVNWFNTDRTHESIDDLTPLHAEQVHYRHQADLAEAS